MRSIVITGDDFGLSAAVNRGILEAHERGVLTAASLMVTGDAFEEAVALAKAHPRLAVGLHLAVSSARSLLPPAEISRLVDPATGRFSSALVKTGLVYQINRAARCQLRMEIRAQLEKFRATGLRLSHVDGHEHMHLHPVALSALIEFSGEFGIQVIRLPGEELCLALAVDRSRAVGKTALAVIFEALGLYARKRLRSAGIRWIDRVYGLLASGCVTEEYLLGLIPHIRADCVEIYAHPTADSGPQRDRLGASREQLAALLSEKVRRALLMNRFTLTTPLEAVGCPAF